MDEQGARLPTHGGLTHAHAERLQVEAVAWASSVVASVGAEAAAWLGEGVVGEVEEAMALPLCHAAQHAARQVP